MVLVFNKNKKRIPAENKNNSDTEMEEYQTRIGLLCDIAEEASSITQVSTLLERILKVTQHSLGSSITSLFLKDEDKARVHLPITVSKCDDAIRRKATVTESEIASVVASDVTPLLINNIAADARFNPKGKKPANFVIRSIIAAPILKGEKVIGVLMAADREDGSDFSERDFEVLQGFATTEALMLLVSLEKTAIDNVNSLALNNTIVEGYRNTVHELASTIDVKDDHVYEHSRRVKEYALLASNHFSLPPEQLRAIEFGALLHDIGKIGIDSEILCKPGPLTDEEWNIMYEHPQKGANILKDIPHLKDAMNIVLCHHERYDGKGYPKQVRGEQIPLGARLVAVANAFDTMTTDHSYRAALSGDEAMKELINGIGTQFCPKATEAFIAAYKKSRGNLPIKANPPDTKTKENKEAGNLTLKVKKTDKEAKAIKIKADKEAKEAKIKAAKAAKEAEILKIKQAKEAKTNTEKEAKEAKINAARKAKEAKIRAEREAREAKALKTKAEQEAKESKVKAAKAAKEAEIARIKAQKEAQSAQQNTQKQTKEAEILNTKAEKEARETKTKAQKEAREAEIRRIIEAKVAKIEAEKEAKEAEIKAEGEAKEAKIKAERESKDAEILRTKAEKESREAKITSEKEAKEAEILKIKAEKEAKKVEKAAQAPKAAPAMIDKDVSKGNIRLLVPIDAHSEAVKRFSEGLKKIEGVKIIMLSHSEEDGHLFLLSLEKPITLISILEEMPAVESVSRKNKAILVTLKEIPNLEPVADTVEYITHKDW